MKIEQSNVSLFSSHTKQDGVVETESLKKWDKPEDNPEVAVRLDKLQLSDLYKSVKQSKDTASIEDVSGDSSIDPKLMAIIRALEALTGKKIDTSFLKKLQPNNAPNPVADKPANSSGTDEVKPLGWGIDYSYQRTQTHEESLDFSAQGSVKSQDGKSIDFSLALRMKSSTQVSESISLKAGDALTDPLVINFGADTVTISDIQKKFDLNLDGKSDTFSFVGNGSGFLALDKNHDGTINNGSELFGPTKGNGFKELAAYDSDKNNWIDENDAIFKSLVIWTKDEQGVENLYSLKDKNVGALYLGSANTQFDLNDSNQKTQALLRESSVYLKESGGEGTLQEVDLKV